MVPPMWIIHKVRFQTRTLSGFQHIRKNSKNGQSVERLVIIFPPDSRSIIKAKNQILKYEFSSLITKWWLLDWLKSVAFWPSLCAGKNEKKDMGKGKYDPWYLSGASWSVEVKVPEDRFEKQDFKEAGLKYSTISPHSCYSTSYVRLSTRCCIAGVWGGECPIFEAF